MKVIYLSLFLLYFLPLFSVSGNPVIDVFKSKVYTKQLLLKKTGQSSVYDDAQANIIVQKELFMAMVLEAFKNNNADKEPITELVEKIRTEKIYVAVWNEILQHHIIITEKDLYERLLPYMPWDGQTKWVVGENAPHYKMIINNIPSKLTINDAHVKATGFNSFKVTRQIYDEFSDLIYNDSPKARFKQ